MNPAAHYFFDFDAGVNAGFTAGPVGPAGSQGPIGKQGPAGPSGTFTIQVVFGSWLPKTVLASVSSAGTLHGHLDVHHGGRNISLATGNGGITQAGTATLTFHKNGGRSVRALKGKKLAAKLTVVFTPAGGGAPVSPTQTVQLKG